MPPGWPHWSCLVSGETLPDVKQADKVVLSQVFDVGERYWLKVWGEGAYSIVHDARAVHQASYIRLTSSIYGPDAADNAISCTAAIVW